MAACEKCWTEANRRFLMGQTSLSVAALYSRLIRDNWCGDGIDPEPNIGDTCCGKCPGGTCYVDQVTGA